MRSQPKEYRSAAHSSAIRGELSCATRFPRRCFETVVVLCRFTPHGAFIPSDSSRITSDFTPRIVDVIGTTVAVARKSSELFRVITTTGRFLSGAANAQIRTSPRASLPAILPPTPTIELHRDLVDVPCRQLAPALRVRESRFCASARAAHRAPVPSGFAWSAWQPVRWPAGALYRAQSALFPYVDPSPQYTQHQNCRVTRLSLPSLWRYSGH